MTDDKPADQTDKGFYGQSKARVGYDRCNHCNGLIKWIKDKTGRFFASVPGSNINHRCRSTYQSPPKEREGYL